MEKTWNEITPVEEQAVVKNLLDWMKDWLESIKPERNKLSLMFPVWDAEFRGKIRGQLGLIVGLGGSKKSMLAQNIALHNLAFNDSNILASTMEMSATQWINRTIDICEDPINNWSPAWAIEFLNQKDPGFAEKKYTDLCGWMKNKLWLTENSAMTANDYDKQLTYLLNNDVKIDMLLIDGLSMMGSDVEEVRAASKNTKELKELAKKWDIAILLICHVSRGEGAHRVKPEDRDCSKQIRGGEKAKDNCDYYICCSQVEYKTDYFSNNYGYARLVNKRGSGNIIDQIFEVERMKCSIIATDMSIDNIKGLYHQEKIEL
jgi:replicative DNA helicase